MMLSLHKRHIIDVCCCCVSGTFCLLRVVWTRTSFQHSLEFVTHSPSIWKPGTLHQTTKMKLALLSSNRYLWWHLPFSQLTASCPKRLVLILALVDDGHTDINYIIMVNDCWRWSHITWTASASDVVAELPLPTYIGFISLQLSHKTIEFLPIALTTFYQSLSIDVFILINKCLRFVSLPFVFIVISLCWTTSVFLPVHISTLCHSDCSLSKKSTISNILLLSFPPPEIVFLLSLKLQSSVPWCKCNFSMVSWFCITIVRSLP